MRKIKSDRSGDHPESLSYCMPTLPDHLDRLLNLPWSSEASLAIDRWLWQWEQEFEGVEQ